MENKEIKKENSNEIQSLNNKLYDEFSIEKLERRLETTPLISNGILGTISEEEIPPIEPYDCFCNPICDLGFCAIY